MKHFIYILLTAMLLASCETKIGEFVDYEAPRLVVNALITAGGENQQLRIHKTGLTTPETVKGADISIAVNGNEIFSQITDGNNPLLIANNDIRPGDLVTISAKKDDMLATASVEVPQTVIITGIDTMMVKVKQNSWSNVISPHTRYLVHLRLPDTAQKDIQYFRVEVEKDIHTPAVMSMDWNINEYVIDDFRIEDDHSKFMYTYDPALTETENVDQEGFEVSFDWLEGVENMYHVFRSTFFKDGEYTLRLDLPRQEWWQDQSHGGWDQHVRIRIYSIPKIEYHYLQALSAAKYYERDIINNGEPMIPTNINGGAGIFCVESVAEIIFHEDHLNSPLSEEGIKYHEEFIRNNY